MTKAELNPGVAGEFNVAVAISDHPALCEIDIKLLGGAA